MKKITQRVPIGEKALVDKAYAHFLAKGGQKDPYYDNFNRWLWENFQVKWDTGRFFERDDLVFESESHMTMFLIKFGGQ